MPECCLAEQYFDIKGYTIKNAGIYLIYTTNKCLNDILK